MAAAPSALARAPGRVNLIGEHVDYNGLPVLPIAIDRSVRIEFRVLDEPVVRLDNATARFEAFEFRLDRPVKKLAQGHWSNYVRAAARGLVEDGWLDSATDGGGRGAPGAGGERLSGRRGPAGSARAGSPPLRGIQGTVCSDLPMALGLSSSSALVVASALALLKANGVETGDGAARLELAALLARAERFVGLAGGGMDQAACLHGAAGHALRIEFGPLRVTPVPVPKGWRWVVASSLARAEKSAGARVAYNTRARECAEALEVVGRSRAWAGVAYRDLVKIEDLSGLLRHAGSALSPVHRRRFRHVVTEGRRVALAEEAMRDGDMRRFGDLMVRSHASLRDDCQVSTEALDAIVEAAMGAGAAGARLTGAGFGGCAVALCGEGAVEAVMEALAARFFTPRLGRWPAGEEVFAVRAAGGAEVTARQ